MGKDPAFLFYDGDAAKDVSHMNRLERGCYFDIIQAQRKFGKMPEQLIKKILGSDFEQCWESIKICLSYVEDMYYIEWLHDSIEKRKKYSESRSNNRKGLKKEKNKHHMKNICETYDKHMENENKIENKDTIKNEIPEHLKEIWLEYKKMRTKIKKYLTTHAEKLALKKLTELSQDESTQIKIIEQSIMNSWQGFFPLKENTTQKNNASPENSQYNNREPIIERREMNVHRS